MCVISWSNYQIEGTVFKNRCKVFLGVIYNLNNQAVLFFRSILIEHAEIALHSVFGNKVYWKARRSMRFNTHLKDIAADFRKTYLNSTNEKDNTVLPTDWLKEKVKF